MFPDLLKQLTSELGKLPGVGPKTALRYALHFFYSTKESSLRLASLLSRLHDGVKTCAVCGNITEKNICNICEDSKRDERILCVVADARDIAAIEKTDAFFGRYHVLGGTISPIEGITPECLRINELLNRLQKNQNIKEIVLAFNQDIEGETTTLYLIKQLSGRALKLTRLARGLPLGSDLEYIDEVTLAHALKGRRETA